MAALAAAAGQQTTAALEHAAAALAAARRHATSALAAARRHTVGYDYATVVERGEWWRLSASLVGPGGLAPLVVMAYAIPCGRGTVADAVWWTAALHSGGCLGGLAWTRRGGRDDVTGAAGAAAGWAAKRATDGAVGAPALVVAVALLAPTRPRAPLFAAAALGAASVAWPVVAAVGASGYWRSISVFWALLVTLASRKATRPRACVPGVAFARWPPRRSRDADAARPGDVSLDGAAGDDLRRRRRRPPAPGRLERGRRRVPRALGAHGGPVFPWLVVDDRPAS